MRRFSVRFREAGISPARLRELQGYCGQYRELQRALRLARAGIVDRNAPSGKWKRADPTGNAALALADHPAAKRIKLIDACAAAVAEPAIARAIIASVADGAKFAALNPPCGERQFYYYRQSFYIELDRRLGYD